KVLKVFNLSCLDPNSDKSLQIGHQLGKSVQYFTAGVCSGKTLVITMKKKNAGESHFSAYEPVENAGQHRGTFSLSFGKSNKSDWFKLYREFYVGSDSSQLLMLAKMVCVVCPKGFEILMLDHLGSTQVFPSRKEPDFAFLDARPGSEPISMFKLNSGEFLMCYSDFAFKMTKKGELAKKELIEWEGKPQSFALAYPYILAFEDDFVEVRHVETGALEQLILGDNIRRLHSNQDANGNAVIQLFMSDPVNPEVRHVVKLIPSPPPAKAAFDTLDRHPDNPYGPSGNQNQYQIQMQAKRASAHLMSAPLAPVLSTGISSPAVLTSHTQFTNGHEHYQQSATFTQNQVYQTQHQHQQYQYNHSSNTNLSHGVVQQSPSAGPRPSPRAYPQSVYSGQEQPPPQSPHPYSASFQPYPTVHDQGFIAHPNGSNLSLNQTQSQQQQQQQQQQHHHHHQQQQQYQQQQQQQQHEGQFSAPWGTGAFP
ncbi:RHO1 GDP-GTP exchange protein 2, partial [Lunasporangiospora selenospora]